MIYMILGVLKRIYSKRLRYAKELKNGSMYKKFNDIYFIQDKYPFKQLEKNMKKHY